MNKFNLRITGDLGFEFWKDIPEYEGLYQASTYGRIKRLGNIAYLEGYGAIQNADYIRKPTVYNGYYRISICNGNYRRNLKCHRIVAEVFLPKWRYDYDQVNHKDENRLNNRVENLEWCDSKYNNNYGSHNEKISLANGKSVSMYSMSGEYIRTFSSTLEACRSTGINNTCISRCANHLVQKHSDGHIYESRSAGGYKWEWA